MSPGSSSSRRLVENQLPEDVRIALPGIEESLGIPPGRWWDCNPLRVALETVAVAELARELEQRHALSATLALEEAEFALGIREGTAARRLRRWRRKVSMEEDS